MTILRLVFMKKIEEIGNLIDRQLAFESFFPVPGHFKSASHTEIHQNWLIFCKLQNNMLFASAFLRKTRNKLTENRINLWQTCSPKKLQLLSLTKLYASLIWGSGHYQTAVTRPTPSNKVLMPNIRNSINY